jgi:DNA-binding transcriptional LysR family regulator
MRHRHTERNVPTELMRTAVAVADAGSYAGAARQLGLGQRAVVAQVHRLQKILGGEIFDVSDGSPRPTACGEAFVESARRMLGVSDQLLSLTKQTPRNTDRIVLGFHNSIAAPALSRIFQALAADNSNKIIFRNLMTPYLLHGLESGSIDIALLSDPPREPPVTAVEWWEPFYWVKGRGFRFDPAKPVPLVSSSGGLSDRYGMAALKGAGLRHAIAFVDSPMDSRLAAVGGGLGIMAVPARSLTDEVVIAEDPGLPALPRVRYGIYLRSGLERMRVERIISTLEAQLRPPETYDSSRPLRMKPKLFLVKSE